MSTIQQPYLPPFPQRKSILKPWGYEIIWAETDEYVGKILQVHALARLSLQEHTMKRETLMLYEGEAVLEINGQEYEMQYEQGYQIDPGVKHRIIALTECVLIEVSTPEVGYTIRHEDDYGRETVNLGS